ncbi:hypothetical protein TIFTF001_045988, partial [Ficus carica]
MRTVNCTQFKPGLKDPRSRKAGQISIATYDAIALFDFGATHSFISLEFAQKLGI